MENNGIEVLIWRNVIYLSLSLSHKTVDYVLSPTGGGRSVGIVRSRTKATEFSLVYVLKYDILS
jgi:hypothetical protein